MNVLWLLVCVWFKICFVEVRFDISIDLQRKDSFECIVVIGLCLVQEFVEVRLAIAIDFWHRE